MSIPTRLSQYLEHNGARYDLCSHERSATSAQSAHLAHIPEHRLAKSVILEDDDGSVMAVVPADTRVRVGELARVLGREKLHLADEQRVAQLFDGCAPGAVPAFGMAWGVKTVVDDGFDADGEIYVEGGDHQSLLRMSCEQFNALMREAQRGHFARSTVH